MTATFLEGLILGMIGSFHCIGMCGPLAFSLPLSTNNDFAKFAGSLVYNLGRIMTYTSLGVLFGLTGKSLSLFGFQQGLSITIGISILLFMFTPTKLTANTFGSHVIAVYNNRLRSTLGRLFFRRNYQSLFAIGLLNGLLPCGMIYIAIAAASVSADPFKSGIFMAAFGMGTLPVMWSVSFFGNYIGLQLRRKIRGAYPVILALMACLFILRGLGLGIPYVSPSKVNHPTGIQNCHPADQHSRN